MNQLGALATRKELTMTSLEISELVGSRHDNVCRSIERCAEDGAISLPPAEEVKIQRERRMEKVKAYVFSGEQGKRDSIIVMAQLSPVFTGKIVDRWQELEAKVKETEIAISWRKLDAEIQKDAMRVLKETLVETYGEEVGGVEYIKANTILNKATSNLYGFEKMVKKPDMNQLMLEDRQRACKKFAHMLLAGIEPKDCKEILYKMFKPKELPAPAESK